jgi:hypothetical protein
VTTDPLGQVFLGLTLAATAGLRAWLPLLVVSILANSHALQINTQLEWLANPTTLAILAIATLLEIAADKLPALDHLMDSFGLLLRPVAGALVMSSTLTFTEPAVGMVLGIAAGALAAEVVGLGKLTTRLVTNASTAGTSTPAISLAEDSVAAGGVALGFLVPYVVGFGVVVLVLLGLPRLRSLPRFLKRVKSPPRRLSQKNSRENTDRLPKRNW